MLNSKISRAQTSFEYVVILIGIIFFSVAFILIIKSSVLPSANQQLIFSINAFEQATNISSILPTQTLPTVALAQIKVMFNSTSSNYSAFLLSLNYNSGTNNSIFSTGFNSGLYLNSSDSSSSSVYSNYSGNSFLNNTSYYSPIISLSNSYSAFTNSISDVYYESLGVYPNGSFSPILDLHFENDTKDDSSFNNNGVLINSPNYVSSCLIGGCFSFNGLNQSIINYGTNGFNLNSPLSLSFWLKPDSIQLPRTILTIGNSTQNIDIRLDSSGNVTASVYSASIPNTPLVIISNYNGNSVTVINDSSDTEIANYTGIIGPKGVTLDADGNAWIAESTTNDVVKMNPLTGAILANISTGTTPNDIAIDANNNIWVTSENSDSVYEIDPVTNSVVRTFTGFNFNVADAIDSSGNVWITNYNTNSLMKINSINGTIYNYSGFDGPKGIAVDGLGHIWVSDWLSNNVSEVNASNGVILANYTVLNQPMGVAVDSNNNVWVTDYNNGGFNGTISEISAISSSEIGNYSVGSHPYGIGVDSHGLIWVTNALNNTVMYLNSSGQIVGTLPVSNSPYTLGDITGFQRQNFVRNQSILNCANSTTGLVSQPISTSSYSSVQFSISNTGDTLIVNNQTAIANYTSCAFTAQNNANFSIASGIFNQSFFQGNIDELHLYNALLNSSQFSNIYAWEKNGSFIHDFTNTNIYSRYKNFSFNSSNLLGWWDLGNSADNETAVNKSLDLSGNNNPLIFYNSPSVSSLGIIGNSLQFSGNNYLEPQINPDFNPSISNFTILVWADSTSGGTILASFDSSGTGRIYLGIDQSINCGEGSKFYTFLNGSALCSSFNVLANQWLQLGVQYNGSAISIIVNGTIVNSSVITPSSDSGNFIVGTNKLFSQTYSGKLSDLMFFNRSLSSTEISNLYNNGNPAGPGGQESNWTNWS